MPITVGHDTSKTRKTLTVGDQSVAYYSIPAATEAGLGDFSKLPAALKVVLENMLRFEDGKTVTTDDIKAFAEWATKGGNNPREIAYRPARVLMQDFTGVPAVVDLAAMRDGLKALGGDPEKINPLNPVDLVIDHSVMIDEFGNPRAFQMNVDREYERNMERYVFLKWGQKAFNNFRVVPPGTGICHQVNLEYLAQTVWSDKDQNGELVAYPDTLVGTDSHTTMVNGAAVLGWGVGGIEAEAAMLGQPISMLIPEVVGFELTGRMMEGTTGTDLVLKVVEMLREKGVVSKFVEFYGEGLDHLPLADRATIANMAPEYGATCGFFPIDDETLRYLTSTGRDKDRIALVEAYAKENGFWRGADYAPIYTDTLHLDMGTIVPAISGPKRPQDYIALTSAHTAFAEYVKGVRGGADATASSEVRWEGEGGQPEPREIPGDTGNHKRGYVQTEDGNYQLHDGSIVIASITSCTNTSNPYVMIGAGLVARKARALGLTRKPWVKTSLAPGSQVVSHYLEAAGLQEDLDAIGFNLVGYGCTTCIGNSGPLEAPISKAINDYDLIGTSVLSGNRNFEGRISPDVRANYLASPPLVVAYALVGDMNVDLANGVLGQDKDGNDVYLKDIWPSTKEVAELVEKTVTRAAFQEKYADVFKGDEKWQGVEVTDSMTYDWPPQSTYVQNPPYFQNMSKEPGTISNIKDAKVLAVLGDMITTDHISPAGSFKESTPAGQYLVERQVPVREFNSYGSRRGNHEVMMRGTFANIRIKNEMLDGVEGGYTKGPDGKQTSIFDAAMAYQETGTPLVIFGGEQYGAGSSRDWAAKGTALLGVKAVIAENFERIHRSNLVGMGVIPFEFTNGDTRKSLGLTGEETVSISGLDTIKPLQEVPCTITMADGSVKEITIKCRIDTAIEIEYIEHGGVLHYVLRNLAAESAIAAE
ncbi:aconitate hydratase AcnA [Sulfitobacter pseudonitzschiae]|uniref:Aconitate hydratase n=1 Tax=Pseudosulfitobacter pseudonitzschiae TaxID=1402135 RepID=A0A9Q2NRA7_9RHOB|nr:aconitate hydratase AcnA [Pseudosulfitobacter pseudonitzschiae]MBM2292922.1 aconitate hydratase AcnA [Pseudosulfitobacter pseudonitzschiae]MBM2298550.1 aconitate hydratase AcnA [Pseudosulfitobacter pseudonitzschiae]MBM2303464.1 aconitate hydratase AcnA [Pseudosulfitobacter pseudonitzschiae]MBM2313247.1 aconitate hydratase AcnA [Pseudosulfitobacter pseudonitzschiae]MBM2318160.1 aconitate hydratase AcnA [Pseudosulfitobacter pseudonitzschiae]|tara:strand:+ start:11139 stop:13928 length:2790 start_codon:yes stop_codon:yes gene_type:complete